MRYQLSYHSWLLQIAVAAKFVVVVAAAVAVVVDLLAGIALVAAQLAVAVEEGEVERTTLLRLGAAG